MIKEIPKSDVITRPMKVYKEWTLDENDIYPIFGTNGANTLINIDTDAKSHSYNKKVIYASIKSQFYTNPSTASIITEVGRRKSYASTDERVLENEIAVFSIPQIYYGEGIKVGTVVLEDEQLVRTYTDDGYSNLIDSGSNIKGNIFYDRGLIVLTRDITSGSVLSQFTLNFRSTKTIFDVTKVTFRELSEEAIRYYLDNYKPFDKAGSYGIQDWIGFIGVEKIEGSYTNVMGLPTQELYLALQDFKA